MPTFPTVNIPIQLLGNQPVQTLIQLANATNNVNIRVRAMNANLRQTQQNLQGMGSAARNAAKDVASGVGAFFLLHQGATMAYNLFATGVDRAAEYESALIRLQFATRASKEEMGDMSHMALKLSNQLGPVDILDVVRVMEALRRTVGGTIPNIMKFTDEFSNLVNAMTLISEGKVMPQQSTNLIQRVVSSFGGLHGKSEQEVRDVFQSLFAAIAAYQPFEPENLVRGIQAVAPTFRQMNLPLDQAMMLAAWRTVLPIAGAKGAGRDIASFLEQSVSISGRISAAGGKTQKRMREAAMALGLMRDGKSALITPGTGKPDVVRLVSSMVQAIDELKKNTPADQYTSKLIQYFNAAYGQQLGARFAKALATEEGFRSIVEILDRLKEVPDFMQASQQLEEGTKGAIGKLSSNLQNFMMVTFRGPSAVVGKVATYLADRVDQFTQVADKNSSVRGGAATFLSAGAAAIFGAIAGYMTKNLGVFLAKSSLFGAGLATTATAAGTGLMFLSKLNIWVALISAIFTAAAFAYEASPAFKEAVDNIVTPVKTWYQSLKDGTLKLLADIFPASAGPEEPGKETLYGTRYWFKSMKDFITNMTPDKAKLLSGADPMAGMKNVSANLKAVKDPVVAAAMKLGGYGKSALYGFASTAGAIGVGIGDTIKGLMSDPKGTVMQLYNKVTAGITSFFNALVYVLGNVVADFIKKLKEMQASIDASAAVIGTQIQAARIPNVPPPTPTPTPTPSKGAEEKPLPHTQFPKSTPSHPGVHRAVTSRAVGDYIAGVLQDTLQREMAASGTNRAHSSVTRPPHQR